MNNKEKMDEKLNSLLKDKKVFNLIVVILIGMILIICSNFFKNTDKKSNAKEVEALNNKESSKEQESIDINITEYENKLKNELKNTLERMEGVGKIDVMIYFNSGEEQIPAINESNSMSTTEEEDDIGGKRNISQNNTGKNIVITNENGKTKPLIVKKYKPSITGVFIVAEGAEEKVTELRIKKAVCTLFNLKENKVNVYPMKN